MSWKERMTTGWQKERRRFTCSLCEDSFDGEAFLGQDMVLCGECYLLMATTPPPNWKDPEERKQ